MKFTLKSFLLSFSFIVGFGLFSQQDRFMAENFSLYGPVTSSKSEFYSVEKPNKPAKLTMTVEYEFSKAQEIEEYTIEMDLTYLFIEISNKYVRNEQGWVIEELMDDGDKKYTAKKYEYNDAGKIVEIKEYDRDEDLSVTISYEYDERGNIVVIDVDSEAKGRDYKKEYEYNDNDKAVKFKYTSTYYKESITYIYDEDDNVVEENFKSSYTDSKGKLVSEVKNTYRTFDGNNNCIDATDKDGNGKVLEIRKYEYDEAGNQIAKYVYNAKMKLTEHVIWKEFDDQGNWQEEYQYTKNKLTNYELREIEY